MMQKSIKNLIKRDTIKIIDMIIELHVQPFLL